MNGRANESPNRFWPTLAFRRYWFLVAFFLLLAAVVAPFDSTISAYSNRHFLRGDLTRIIMLSEIFAHGFGIILVLVGIFVLSPASRRFLPRLAICGFFPGLLVQGLKAIFARKRPTSFQGEFPLDVAETWVGFMPKSEFNGEYFMQSFPSAHTATAISFAIGMAWIFPRGRWLFFVCAALAAYQRVVFEAHWMSDVMVGAAMGTMVGCAMTQNWGFGYWCGLYEKSKDKPHLRLADFGDESELGEKRTRIAA